MKKTDCKNISSLKNLALNKKKDFKRLLAILKKQKAGMLDREFNELHNTEFDEIDCLDCANCCRDLGPRITEKDIDKLAANLRIKTADFIEKFLIIDEDKDYVFKTMPCPFLMPDNYCSVYEARPKACKEYPHTNQSNIKPNLNQALKNTETCPAVYNIFLLLEKKYL
jgi:uncharacterized protein